jgi:hypothetical protein
MAKLDNTSGTVIAITFLVMNLATWWRRVFCVFLCLFAKRRPVLGWKITYNYNLVESIHKDLYLTELSDIDRSCSWLAIDYSANPTETQQSDRETPYFLLFLDLAMLP